MFQIVFPGLMAGAWRILLKIFVTLISFSAVRIQNGQRKTDPPITQNGHL